jgi:hypothetical protein
MALIKLNNRSVKDATTFGSISSLGELTFISKQTASSSANISFTSGIDSTYKEYIFYYVNCHPATDVVQFQVNFSTDGGSNYNVTKTNSHFYGANKEDGSNQSVSYGDSYDLAQSTADMAITDSIGNGADESVSGYLHLFNPSSTTFVKHFISRNNSYFFSNYSWDSYVAGYCNTTSAVDAVRFKMSSGNIDSGDIILFGLN